MKKKYFILIFIGLIAMITVSFILQNLYSEKTRYFGFAAGMFFIAVFALFSYKNALKPTGFISEKNSSKAHYQKRGELPKYKQICKSALILLSGLGSLFLLRGLIAIIVTHLKA